MPPTLAVILLTLLALTGCSKRQDLKTIEEAEDYALVRGLVLAEKTEIMNRTASSRAFRYVPMDHGTVIGRRVSIRQFPTPEVAEAYMDACDDIAICDGARIHLGHIVFSVEGSEVQTQLVVGALEESTGHR